MQPHNTVYKLIGPGLVKQEQHEAKTNVSKRLEFINKEMYAHRTLTPTVLTRQSALPLTLVHLGYPLISLRVEDNLKDLSSKSEKKKTEVCPHLPPHDSAFGPCVHPS